jgi:hypothetical protein
MKKLQGSQHSGSFSGHRLPYITVVYTSVDMTSGDLLAFDRVGEWRTKRFSEAYGLMPHAERWVHIN